METQPKIVETAAEPKPTTSIDYERASRDFKRYQPLKLVTFIWFAAVLGLAVYALAALWSDWWPYGALGIDTDGAARLAVNSVAGALLGATTFAFRGFYWAVGPQSDTNRRYRYDPNWTFWYVARPVLGVALGVVIYAAMRAGVATLGTVSTDSTAAAGYFVIGFLAGFSSTQMFDWLEGMAKKLFASESGRESGS